MIWFDNSPKSFLFFLNLSAVNAQNKSSILQWKISFIKKNFFIIFIDSSKWEISQTRSIRDMGFSKEPKKNKWMLRLFKSKDRKKKQSKEFKARNKRCKERRKNGCNKKLNLRKWNKN